MLRRSNRLRQKPIFYGISSEWGKEKKEKCYTLLQNSNKASILSNSSTRNKKRRHLCEPESEKYQTCSKKKKIKEISNSKRISTSKDDQCVDVNPKKSEQLKSTTGCNTTPGESSEKHNHKSVCVNSLKNKPEKNSSLSCYFPKSSEIMNTSDFNKTKAVEVFSCNNNDIKKIVLRKSNNSAKHERTYNKQTPEKVTTYSPANFNSYNGLEKKSSEVESSIKMLDTSTNKDGGNGKNNSFGEQLRGKRSFQDLLNSYDNSIFFPKRSDKRPKMGGNKPEPEDCDKSLSCNSNVKTHLTKRNQVYLLKKKQIGKSSLNCTSQAMNEDDKKNIGKTILTKEETNKANFDKKIVEERLKSYVHIQHNVYNSEKKNTHGDWMDLGCHCFSSKKRSSANEKGCVNCINKIVMNECGDECHFKENCSNKKFQNHEYANVEVFNAGKKGCGVRAMKDLLVDTFVMEYVGEVIDNKEFNRRKENYTKNGNEHFYFMQLNDTFIDGSTKGNISRFVNYSCNPNAKMQKWNVRGTERIGLFLTKDIIAGEEITIDYNPERNGIDAKKCDCGTETCRGWLRKTPTQKTKEKNEPGNKKFTLDYDESLLFTQKNSRLNVSTLMSLMLRANILEVRFALLNILMQYKEKDIKTFLIQDGLKILCSWMNVLSTTLENEEIKAEMTKFRNKALPIILNEN